MNFKEVKAALERKREAIAEVERLVPQRKWMLTNQVVIQCGVHILGEHEESYFTLEGYNAFDLNRDLLNKITLCRDIFDRWLQGEIDELPIETPCL